MVVVLKRPAVFTIQPAFPFSRWTEGPRFVVGPTLCSLERFASIEAFIYTNSMKAMHLLMNPQPRDLTTALEAK